MKNFANLKRDCPFYDLFPSGLCPITNIILPSQVRLEGSSETEVYMVDLNKVSDTTLSQIARRLALKSGAPETQVFREIKEKGLPLRVNQTDGCSTDAPFFL